MHYCITLKDLIEKSKHWNVRYALSNSVQELMSKNPVPGVVRELSICNCKKGCKTNSCSCRKNNMVCSDACRCNNYATC